MPDTSLTALLCDWGSLGCDWGVSSQSCKRRDCLPDASHTSHSHNSRHQLRPLPCNAPDPLSPAYPLLDAPVPTPRHVPVSTAPTLASNPAHSLSRVLPICICCRHMHPWFNLCPVLQEEESVEEERLQELRTSTQKQLRGLARDGLLSCELSMINPHLPWVLQEPRVVLHQ